MVKIEEILRAIDLVETKYLSMTWTERQLKGSLEIYKTKGEFDGSTQSAIECLKRTGYEIEGVGKNV